jgi:hypothetical protein
MGRITILGFAEIYFAIEAVSAFFDPGNSTNRKQKSRSFET